MKNNYLKLRILQNFAEFCGILRNFAELGCSLRSHPRFYHVRKIADFSYCGTVWMALLNGPFPRKMNTKRSSSRSFFQWWYCRKSLSLNRRRCSIINSHTKAAAALSPVRPKTNAQVTPRDTERENIFGTKLLTLAAPHCLKITQKCLIWHFH